MNFILIFYFLIEAGDIYRVVVKVRVLVVWQKSSIYLTSCDIYDYLSLKEFIGAEIKKLFY